jgi:hypothetical protein
MKWSELPLNPATKTLRQFAAISLVFFLGVGTFQWMARGRPTLGFILIAIGLFIGILGLVQPRAVRWVFAGWMIAAFPIGWTVSQLMLVLLFYGIFTPIGFLLKLTGRDSLSLKFPAQTDSYWTTKPAPTDVRRYFKQF